MAPSQNIAIASRGAQHSQQGVALIATLLALSVITMIGLTMVFVSATESLINHNNKSKLTNLYSAESAAEEARSKIKTLLPIAPDEAVYLRASSSINPTTGSLQTNSDFDPGYSSSETPTVRLVDSDLSQVTFSWVKVVLKTETRAGYSIDADSSNNDQAVFYGFDNNEPTLLPFQFAGAKPYHVGSNVYLVTALARDSSGGKQQVRTEFSSIPKPYVTAAFLSRNPVEIQGTNVMVNGLDANVPAPVDLIGIESQGNVIGNTAQVQGTPALLEFSGTYVNMPAMVEILRPPVGVKIETVDSSVTKNSSGVYSGANLALGVPPDAADPIGQPGSSVPTFVGGPLVVSGNSSGQGILVVNGDLTVTGSFRYYGLVVVKGVVNLDGAVPGIDITGTVIAFNTASSGSSVLAGTVRIQNDSTFINKPFNELTYTRLSFREISMWQ